MLATLRPAAVMLGLLTLVTGVLYPLAVTGIARVAFPARAEGSLLRRGDRVIGSSLIGQAFEEPRHFWGRPSATLPHPYNAASSGGSNLGPGNPALATAIERRLAILRAADPAIAGTPVPVELVTSSGSGLDPHLSPAAALFQVGRVARARGLSEARVRELVERLVEGRTFGILGEPRVNVLRLNLELDRLSESGGLHPGPGP